MVSWWICHRFLVSDGQIHPCCWLNHADSKVFVFQILRMLGIDARTRQRNGSCFLPGRSHAMDHGTPFPTLKLLPFMVSCFFSIGPIKSVSYTTVCSRNPWSVAMEDHCDRTTGKSSNLRYLGFNSDSDQTIIWDNSHNNFHIVRTIIWDSTQIQILAKGTTWCRLKKSVPFRQIVCTEYAYKSGTPFATALVICI